MIVRADHQRAAIRDQCGSAQELSDLMPLLHQIEVSKLREFVSATLMESNDEKSRQLYFLSLSINRTLPDVIIQHILSFDRYSRNRTVCSKWNVWNQQNEINAIQSVVVSHPLPSDDAARFIIYPGRINENILDKVWNQFDCEEEILKDLRSAFLREECRDGDQILISTTTFECGHADFEKSLHFIGINHHAKLIIKFNEEEEDSYDGCRVNGEDTTLLFEGLTLEMYYHLSVIEGHLILKNAVILMDEYAGTITVHRKASLTVSNCIFIGRNSAITIHHGAAVNISDSIFKGGPPIDNQGFIKIQESPSDHEISNSINIKNNKFQLDRYSWLRNRYPVMARRKPRTGYYHIDSNRKQFGPDIDGCCLQGNVRLEYDKSFDKYVPREGGNQVHPQDYLT